MNGTNDNDASGTSAINSTDVTSTTSGTSATSGIASTTSGTSATSPNSHRLHKDDLRALDPFAPGAGRQPQALVGREEELEIMDRIIARTKLGYADRGLVYSGLRGVGKTVLLLKMRDMAAAQKLMTVRIEATGDERRDYELLFDGLTRAALRERRGEIREGLLAAIRHVSEVSVEFAGLKASIKGSGDRSGGKGENAASISSDALRLEMLVEEICAELKKKSLGLFLFIDEFQEMPTELMGTIIGLQHAMGQENMPFYVIAAGLPNLPGVLTKSRSYAERLFQYKKLDSLPEDETRACFARTLATVGGQFTDDAMDRLVELSQGYPYFIQAYGSAAFNAADSSPIPLSAVEKGAPLARAELDSGLYEARWQRATPSERTYMRAMASLGKPVCASAEIADALGKDPRELSRTRGELIAAGLAYSPERGKLAFTVPGMGDFIQRAAPAEEVPYDRRSA